MWLDRDLLRLMTGGVLADFTLGKLVLSAYPYRKKQLYRSCVQWGPMTLFMTEIYKGIHKCTVAKAEIVTNPNPSHDLFSKPNQVVLLPKILTLICSRPILSFRYEFSIIYNPHSELHALMCTCDSTWGCGEVHFLIHTHKIRWTQHVYDKRNYNLHPQVLCFPGSGQPEQAGEQQLQEQLQMTTGSHVQMQQCSRLPQYACQVVTNLNERNDEWLGLVVSSGEETRDLKFFPLLCLLIFLSCCIF